MITAMDIRNKSVTDNLFELCAITALNEGRSVELDAAYLQFEARRLNSVRGAPISVWELRARFLNGNPYAEWKLREAAAGRESTHYPCRSPRVTARLLRALRERGDDVRARRARWTF